MRILSFLFLLLAAAPAAWANGNVYVSRFWHNHQPLYWPEWNGNGSQTLRKQYAWDSIVLKPGQTYNSGAAHPENDLVQIFSVDDRRNSYQSGPRNSLANLPNAAGFAISYSGSLIDNVRNLGANNQLGYGGGWNNGFTESSNWFTPGGSRRMDLVGFTYHHSLGAVLPKAVLRKEIQIFKQAWWKAWGKNPDHSDHSKGFFPTEMAFSRHMVDVLADEGYQWVIVASHHLSRTCPTYFDQFDLANSQYGIFSSPPNRADLLGPSPNSGWWYSEPNPGNAAWNVAPFAYQLHRAEYVDPTSGAVKTMVMVPSDDVLSYRFGYSNEGIGKIQAFISPHANNPARPVIVMPSSDGDNAWGGGSSSWFEATPQLFNDSAHAGYKPTAVQDFVNWHGAAAPVAHIEDGAWIFPESDYGSPYFLKWVEPPVKTLTATNTVPGTLVDMETPGFALKFWSWAPVIAGANWCETAEQIFTGAPHNGSVQAWKIQAPYDWNGNYTNPNVVERAWHIYLAGLDSGFNYYGGLGNDDEVKSSLATRRAIEILQTFMQANLHLDATPPTIFKPQRFPYNPGGYTFGWFNSIPNGDRRYLKKMASEFYIWSHVHDVSGVQSVNLRLRVDGNGVNALGSHQNETFAGGPEVGSWITVPMTKRVLPNNTAALNAAANNGQINYFSDALSPEIADYYFAKITDAVLPNFRGKLLDYYIEATDSRGNTRPSEIQHVFVEDDGVVVGPVPSQVAWTPTFPQNCAGNELNLRYQANQGPLEGAANLFVAYTYDNWTSSVTLPLAASNGVFAAAIPIQADAANVVFAFNDGNGLWDNRDGANWSVAFATCPQAASALIDPPLPNGCGNVVLGYDPGTGILAGENPVFAHLGFNNFETVQPVQMVLSAGVWRVEIPITNGVHQIDVAFRNADASRWDNNNGNDWHWPVLGCGAAFDPAVCAIEATPLVSADPLNGRNHPGDRFDFSPTGGTLETYAQGGFGSFGRVYVNLDAQALYVGAEGMSTGGSNNVLVVFLSTDTLAHDVPNLWNLNSPPQALDLLHNVQFAEPVDLAILIGDEYGDGHYPNFQIANGYDHGQGLYALAGSSFTPLAGSLLSQFDGNGFAATLSADDDGNGQTDRWEARIPWSDLNASGPADLEDLRISGLILSDAVNGVDRYLSGNFLGKDLKSVSELDVYNNFGSAFVTLTPVGVCLPHLDGDGDGLFNRFELRYFGHAGNAAADADDDEDGHDNSAEQDLGTDPNDETSRLVLSEVRAVGGVTEIHFQTVGGKTYRVETNDSPDLDPAEWQLLSTHTESDVGEGEPDSEMVADSGPWGGHRAYRVRLGP